MKRKLNKLRDFLEKLKKMKCETIVTFVSVNVNDMGGGGGGFKSKNF
jgi:hypothetical protein